jgi:hypothetical protein
MSCGAPVSGPDATFVVERYWPGSSPAEFERVTAQLASQIAGLTTGGVALLHSTYVPADEAAQWVIRAPSAGAVEALCAAAGLTFERLLPAIESGEPDRAE